MQRIMRFATRWGMRALAVFLGSIGLVQLPTGEGAAPLLLVIAWILLELAERG